MEVEAERLDLKTKTKAKKEISENPFLEYINKRIRNNKNFVLAIVGETGSGKSYSALSIASSLDPDFNIDRLAFTAAEFLDLLRKDLPKGSAIVFDECGVAWQSRNFMSFMNRTLSAAMQTVRFKNHIIIMTVPDMSFVDAQGRKLLHMFMVTERIKKKAHKAVLKPYMISIAYRTGKVYQIAPRIQVDGKILKIRKVNVKIPSAILRHQYEKRKIKYANELYRLASEELTGTKSKAMEALSGKHRTVYDLDLAGVKSNVAAKVLGVSLRRVYDLRKENKAAGFEAKKNLVS